MDSVPTAHTSSPKSPPELDSIRSNLMHFKRHNAVHTGIIAKLLNNSGLPCSANPTLNPRMGPRTGKVYRDLNVSCIPFNASVSILTNHALRPYSPAQRRGVTDICFNAAIRSSSGGCVLKSELSVPAPKNGLTMQSDDVLGEMAEVGIRLL
jgi:hypothetical protein